MNFMFEDKDYIKNLVNQRDDDQIVIPLYIQIYGKKYSLLELKDVKVRFTEGAFKVGYGTADALFMPNSFPVKRINDFDVITVFTEYDNVKDRTIRYMVFESGNIDPPADEYINFDTEENDKLSEQIRTYFEMLYNHTKNVVDEYFKSLIAEETVPIIPKEEPKKEEPAVEGEDPLEALRKEVAEYSQDDDSEEESPFEEDPEEVDEEEASEVAFEFEDENEEDEYPRVTGGGILGQETVDFINGEGKYSYDDYLSETTPALIVETDKTGTKIVSATKVDVVTDDYSTDFDIL